MTSKTALMVVVFALGATTGLVINKLNGASVDPETSVDGRNMSGSPAALMTRFDQMEVRLNELSAALNRVDEWALRMGPPDYERKLSATSPGITNKSVNDAGANTTANVSELERTKSRIYDTLQDPTTNFAALMDSKDMRALTPKQRDEVMQEVAARLDSGQLRKEQFLPGYKLKTGAK
jgi:hypothetical protein